MKILGLMILVIGMSGAAMAQVDDCEDGCPVAVPEINGSLATGALALLSGTVLLVRSRYKK